MTGLTFLEWIKLAIYYASYFYFIAAPAAVWLALQRPGAVRWLSLAFFAVISCLAYGRFVEPRILLVKDHDVALDRCFAAAGAARVAVFSDTHRGLFGNAMPIERIAARVNKTAPDIVFYAGDFVYFLDPRLYEREFGAFANIEAPLYAVLGNHDIGRPGPDFSEPLRAALPAHGVVLIDDSAREISARSAAIELIGLSDDWGLKQDLSLLQSAPQAPRIVLTHNPASVLNFTNTMRSDLLIGGHTHGGQINLPLITCWFTGMCGKRRYGLSRAAESYPHRRRPVNGETQQLAENAKDALIFTTSGTGMVGLPMRFRTPPRIDVLNVSWRACEAAR